MRFYIRDGCPVLNLMQDSDGSCTEFGSITLSKEENRFIAYDGKKNPIAAAEITLGRKCAQIIIKSSYNAAFGLGERFDSVNQKGNERTIEVKEKFCRQGPVSYCPVPFFFTDAGFGVYIDTLRVSRIHFRDDIVITLNGTLQELPELVFFFGKPAGILHDFSRFTGKVRLPPKWSFGPWISANRWNTQAEIEKQVSLLHQHGFSATVLVVEAWSDEATFYIWNGATYQENDGSTGFSYDQLGFEGNSCWPDPKSMIDRLHEEGIHLILWQAPVLKKTGPGHHCIQHDRDRQYAVEHGYTAVNPGGSPYTIPKGHWFAGSMVPDFTNPNAVKWWFDKRRYLLEMGIDGFKTDGGEFIHRDDIKFFDGSTGKEMRNGFAKRYIEAYADFTGKDRVLFSRAGYAGQQSCPAQWAGDQRSSWDELQSVLKAGLSIGLSGVPYWSFDIGGFAGDLPDVELYERSTQLAVFAPIMQWHSEPVGGQFAGGSLSKKCINDRSPWNIAEAYGDAALLDRLRFHYNLRGNLMPALYQEAIRSQKSGLPMIRHLVLDYPEDPNVMNIEDTFMLGDLLVAPFIQKGQDRRRVYLPRGGWIDLWSQSVYCGPGWIISEFHENRIPVYIREGGSLALNLDASMMLGSPAGTGADSYQNLCFYLAGDRGQTCFRDDHGNGLTIRWQHDDISIERKSGAEPFVILRSIESANQ